MTPILVEFAKVFTIFGIAWFSFWAAIPSGLALGLHPLTIILTTSLSYTSGILICILPAQFLRRWVMKRFEKRLEHSTNHQSLIIRLWRRYGVIGFGLVAPMTTGAQLGAIIGITLNIPQRRLMVAMTIGAIIWAVGLTVAGVIGVDQFRLSLDNPLRGRSEPSSSLLHGTSCLK